jgi:hypothetical protein
MAYMQFRFAYSRDINDKLTAGLAVKPIIGQAAASTKIENLELKTGPDEWTLTGDATLFLSSHMKVARRSDRESLKIEDVYGSLSNQEVVKKYVRPANPGVALDLGMTYKIDDQFTVSASVNNLGFIAWNRDVSGIVVDRSEGVKFAGLDIDVSKEGFGEQITNMSKSLWDDVRDESNNLVHNESFRTFLPTIFHAGVSCRLTQRSMAGLLLRTAMWQGSVRQSFNLSYNVSVPGNFVIFNTGLTCQFKSTIYANLGLTFNVGPVQLYGLLDYIPLQWSKISINGDRLFGMDSALPAHMKSFTARIGLNLTF